MYVDSRDLWWLDGNKQAEAVQLPNGVVQWVEKPSRGPNKMYLPDGSMQFVEKGYSYSPWNVESKWRGSDGGMIEIDIGGEIKEQIEIDAEKGPMALNEDGSFSCLPTFASGVEAWSDKSSADQKVLAFKVAKRNHRLRPQIEHRIAVAKEKAKADEFIRTFNAMTPQERLEWRCHREQDKLPARWRTITPEMVKLGHDTMSEGILYGTEFPWNEETLIELGPKWLTKAFHSAGTLNLDNEVTEIKLDPMKIDAGNNAGKFLFEVTYAKDDPDLHTKLFAKVPFPMTKDSSADRISSSVMKQPMDLMEVNTYRLLESSFPMKIPKFYYGDISNTTSNFILITERVPFAEINGFYEDGLKSLKPFEIEGPYEKCKDYRLRGTAKEYYTLLVQVHARIAGLWKAGKICSKGVMQKSLSNPYAKLEPGNPASWGMDAAKATGDDPAQASSKIQFAVKFISETAKQIYPSYVVDESFKKKFTETLMKFQAYNKELDYFRAHLPDYLSLGHANLNADNAFFWRDDSGTLDCGVFDFGGFGMRSVGQTIWWTFNCADFDQFKEHLPDYMDAFINLYHENGGPKIGKELLLQMICFSALENILYMVAAVPNCLKQCPAAEFATIRDRSDPRISGNITGKSTLRTTIQVMGNGIRLIEEMGVDLMLQRWIDDVFVGEWKQIAKSDEVVFGR